MGILVKLTEQNSCWRQAKMIRYHGWGMSNLIGYGEWSDIKGGGFSLNWLSKDLATTRQYKPDKDKDGHQGQGLEGLQETD